MPRNSINYRPTAGQGGGEEALILRILRILRLNFCHLPVGQTSHGDEKSNAILRQNISRSKFDVLTINN